MALKTVNTILGAEKEAEEAELKAKKEAENIIAAAKEKAGEITKEYMQSREPLEIVNGEIIPTLNIVGDGFEKKTMYLPQLLMSAEAAKTAFEIIKSALVGKDIDESKGVFVLATVYGDIHDIGKNIVKLLLENYGFQVVDLGKNVPAEDIVKKVIELKAPQVVL